MTTSNPDRTRVDDATTLHVNLVKTTAEAVLQRAPVSHYNGDVEPIDLIRSLGILAPFAQGNIIKYVSRYDRKGGADDLKKAKVYLNWLIQEVEGE